MRSVQFGAAPQTICKRDDRQEDEVNRQMIIYLIPLSRSKEMSDRK